MTLPGYDYVTITVIIVPYILVTQSRVSQLLKKMQITEDFFLSILYFIVHFFSKCSYNYFVCSPFSMLLI